MGFFKKALKSAGKAVTAPGKVLTVTAKPVNKIGRTLGKVPIVGKGIQATFSMTTAAPLNFAARVASNPRQTHRAGYNLFKSHVKSTVDLAPYAASVASFVPGVGTGVAAGISAGYALSKGRSIDQALKEGVKGAVPGGPLLQGTVNAVADISSGKPISKVQLDTLSRAGVPDAAAFKADLDASLEGDLSAMARVDANLNLLKKDSQKAVQVGIALGYAERLQDLILRGVTPAVIAQLKTAGLRLTKQNQIFAAGLKADFWAKDADVMVEGYLIGIGAMTFKLNEPALAAISKYVADKRVGFLTGIAAYTGSTLRKPLPEGTAKQQLTYYITLGITGVETKYKDDVLAAIKKDSEQKHIIKVVVSKTWLDRLIYWLGF